MMFYVVNLAKKLLLLLLCLFPLCNVAQAGVEESARYEEAGLVYAAANASLAVYSDQPESGFYQFLQNLGWRIRPLANPAELSVGKLFLLEKVSGGDSGPLYLLAFCGTASLRDVKTDLRADWAYFQGNGPEEIRRNMRPPHRQGVAADAPRVHAGFLRYALDAFAATWASRADETGLPLDQLLKNAPQARLILTGHSMGGAAATLYAVMLMEMGIPGERIQVVSFGAPAVGGKTFAQKYRERLNLLRVYNSLDPVPRGLQNFYRYTQFGRRLLVKGDPRFKLIQHGMENYADFAGKYYYDCRWAADAEGVAEELSTGQGGDKSVAIALLPAKNDYALADYKYLRENLLDVYRAAFPRHQLLLLPDSPGAVPEAAQAAAGADYLLLARIELGKVKTGKNKWLVALRHSLYKLPEAAFVLAGSFNRQVNEGGSFLQASANNAFSAAEQLKAAIP